MRVRSSFGTSLARGAQVVTVCLSPGRLSTCKLQPCVVGVGVVASSEDEGGGEEWGNGSWLYLNPRARRSAGPGSVPSDSSAERREISVPEMLMVHILRSQIISGPIAASCRRPAGVANVVNRQVQRRGESSSFRYVPKLSVTS